MNLNKILFWTERDDLENNETSSRDPLGTETFAGQLAELILPGLTTITWRIRYLTLICLWLRFIKEELQEDNADKILEYVKNLEKLTAYCAIKRYGENDDVYQTNNLIGKRYAKAYLRKNVDKFSISKNHFPFLVNHSSVSAFTTYKVLLKALGFIEEDEYTLTPYGMDLIRELQTPHPSFVKSILKGDKVYFHSKKFDTLGEFFGLNNFEVPEKAQLKEALCANNLRKAAFMLIKKYMQGQEDEFDIISKIPKAVSTNESENNVITIYNYITRFERLNREIHYIFYSLMDIDVNQTDVHDFLKKANIQDSLNIMTGKALDAYIEFHAGNEQPLGKYDKRPYEFFIQLKRYRDNSEQCIKTIIEHHVKNQRQKNKAPWIEHKNGKCTVILRQYRKNTEEMEMNRKKAVHSYRTRNAWKMIHELAI